MPSTQREAQSSRLRSALHQSLYSVAHFALSRATVLAEKPVAFGPSRAFSAPSISPVEMPLRHRQGSAASNDLALRTYGGTSAEWNAKGLPVFERTLGTFTVTGPMPVCTSRSGWWPLRTTAAWPSGVFRSWKRAVNQHAKL